VSRMRFQHLLRILQNALCDEFGTIRHTFDLNQVLGDGGPLGDRSVAAIGNDSVITFRQDTLGNVVGDPQLQEGDLGTVGALDRDFHEFLAVEVNFLQAFSVKDVRLVLVKDIVDGQVRRRKGLGQVNRDSSGILADDTNSIVGIGRNARVRHQ